MALVSPLLIILMFGSFELGNYFLDEHVVLKAVRDGARYAGRQNFTTMPCSGTPTADAAIKNLVRYGNIAGSGDPRLRYWTSNNTIAVSIACPNSGAYSGIYNGLTGGERIVTVTATVPYGSLFGGVGFGVAGLDVTASAESAVMGI